MRKRIAWEVILLVSCVLVVSAYSSETWYVNNETGNDAFDGKVSEPAKDGKTGPFVTIKKAMGMLKTSDHLEIAGTKTPYREEIVISRVGGTPEEPLVIDGHGCIIDGLDVVPPGKWQKEGEHFYSTFFQPMSNLLKGCRDINYWIGSPQIWFIDGKPAPNCKSREELEKTPGGFWWNKYDKENNKDIWQLLFHPPEGKSITDVKIEIPVRGTGVQVYADYVVVKNIRSQHSWNDGFGPQSGKGMIFQNVVGIDNCGQGFSAHGTSQVTVEDSRFERNASTGVVNVHDCSCVFRRCIIANNTFAGGVAIFNNSVNKFYDCWIYNNLQWPQVYASEGQHEFHNCIIAGSPNNPDPAVRKGEASLLLDGCTIADAPLGVELETSAIGKAPLSMYNTIITRCETILSIPTDPAPPSAGGIIGRAAQFDGVNHFITIPKFPALDAKDNDFTFEAWIRPALLSSCTFMGWVSTPHFYIQNNRLGAILRTGKEYPRAYGKTDLNANTWNHVAATYDQNGAFKMYLNGVPDNAATFEHPGVLNPEQNFYIGKGMDSNEAMFAGLMDEVRVANMARSAEWIAVSYKNQLAPDKFMEIKGEETSAGNWFSQGWKNRKMIRIVKENISGTLTNFPVLVYLANDPGLCQKARRDGADILFTGGDGKTALAHELESYENGRLWAWIKIPLLSSGADTEIYMYYGNQNTAPEALKEKAKVWDDSFVMVQHLNEVSGMRCDSTVHGHNGLGKLAVQMNFNAYDLGRIVFMGKTYAAALWTEYQKRGYLLSWTISYILCFGCGPLTAMIIS